MSNYPDAWAQPVLAAAVAAVGAAGGRVTGSAEHTKTRSIDFVLGRHECRMVERVPKRRAEWVAVEFPWPAAWPDITLIEPGGPASDVYDDPSPPEGFALSSHDLPAARAVVGAGFAAAARDPRAELSIEDFDGAMITTGTRVALNGETARWLLGLLRLLLAEVPPRIPDDHVGGRVYPGEENALAELHGTRAEVLYRLLTLRRHGAAVGLEWDPDDTASIALVAALDRWITEAGALAAASRAADADRVASWQAVRQLARRIGDQLRRSEADGADDDLVQELHDTVAQVAAWDARPGTPTVTASVPTAERKPRRTWRRRD